MIDEARAIHPYRRMSRERLTGFRRWGFGALSVFAFLVFVQSARGVVFQVDGISVSSGAVAGNHVILPLGETVTIGARISDPSSTPIMGVSASYSGWDRGVLSFVSGSSVPSLFHAQCSSGSAGSDGLINVVPSPLIETPSRRGGPIPGSPRVQAIVALSIDPRAAHAGDPGLDGECGNGDAQVRITFRGLSTGETTVTIGTGEDLGSTIVQADGEVAPTVNATVTVTVPEPNGIASLGSGLLVLAIGWSTRRQSASRCCGD